MTGLTANSADELQQGLCQALMEHGHPTDPRGLATKELLGVSFELRNPRNRLTTIPLRRWSASLAVAELTWNIRRDCSVAPLAFYSQQWLDFADAEGVIRGSCYGAKIFGAGDGDSQWSNVRRLLSTEPTSRRAVLSFRDELDVSLPTSDLSCTNTLQFILREGKLHAFVSMRSNDVIWGVPYDIFLFTMLQEQMSVELGVELGSYHHTAASMHVYQRHFELASGIAHEAVTNEPLPMPAIPDVEALKRLASAEEMLREGRSIPVPATEFEGFCLDLLQRHRRLKKAA